MYSIRCSNSYTEYTKRPFTGVQKTHKKSPNTDIEWEREWTFSKKARMSNCSYRNTHTNIYILRELMWAALSSAHEARLILLLSLALGASGSRSGGSSGGALAVPTNTRLYVYAAQPNLALSKCLIRRLIETISWYPWRPSHSLALELRKFSTKFGMRCFHLSKTETDSHETMRLF